jgi:hypothetical protein
MRGVCPDRRIQALMMGKGVAFPVTAASAAHPPGAATASSQGPGGCGDLRVAPFSNTL